MKSFLKLANGIPSHDTFGRVFAAINPEEFERSFMEWVQAINEVTQEQVIAIDGKQLRGSHDAEAGKNALYMVSDWATENQPVLGQRKVDEKSNEITAIPKLLKLLEIKGCIVMVDAIGTQTKIAKTIINQGGDYILGVKENQGNLYEDIRDLFEDNQRFNYEGMPHSYVKVVNTELRYSQTHGYQSAQAGENRQGRHQGQTSSMWLERGLSAQGVGWIRCDCPNTRLHFGHRKSRLQYNPYW